MWTWIISGCVTLHISLRSKQDQQQQLQYCCHLVLVWGTAVVVFFVFKIQIFRWLWQFFPPIIQISDCASVLHVWPARVWKYTPGWIYICIAFLVAKQAHALSFKYPQNKPQIIWKNTHIILIFLFNIIPHVDVRVSERSTLSLHVLHLIDSERRRAPFAHPSVSWLFICIYYFIFAAQQRVVPHGDKWPFAANVTRT